MTDDYKRRQYLKAAGVTGLGVLSSLAGCTRGGSDGDSGGDSSGGSTSGGSTTEGSGGGDSGFSEDLPIPLSEYDSADIEWQQFEGDQINIGAVSHPWVDAIKPAIPVFEELTGIDVVWNILPENQFRTKRQTDVSTGSGQFDVFFMDQVVNQFRNEDWLQPLDPYINDGSMFDESWYDMDDLFESSIWQAHGGGYSDTWTGMPITVEVQTQYYRQDLYDKHGLEVPETWQHHRENAKVIHEEESDIVGTAGRGLKGYGMNIYILNTLLRQEGSTLWTEFPNDSGLDTQGVIKAAEYYTSLLQDYGPQGASSQAWSDVQTTMQEGRTGHIVADANLFWGGLTSDESSVQDTVRITKVPKPEGGELNPNAFNWQISTSQAASNSEQAFLFMVWATSEPTNTWMHTENGAVFSVRQSVWENDDFISQVGEDFAQVSLESLQVSSPDPFDRRYPEWGQRYSEELQRAIAGQKSAEEAMTDAAAAAEDIYS
ncbi:maltose ABC transporter substrate-binding protein [Halobellus salinus]|uniref:Maltose ABC transporter substrate-binding protein n=1 Tax=Halobellus salinus TaxID=931585 RepID=A0A830EC66_9EURY|nr:extracellular solute-binding protein [Halobellus salinus]GGJ10993.1 maltose ABC transporter substrate-binding protein [Halobellus salinus]SMP10754.1 ABC-type glycerol-3-phosphate transport system, substrate-binding protein [Halobellus salinus]